MNVIKNKLVSAIVSSQLFVFVLIKLFVVLSWMQCGMMNWAATYPILNETIMRMGGFGAQKMKSEFPPIIIIGPSFIFLDQLHVTRY